jgi:hypothetical protein
MSASITCLYTTVVNSSGAERIFGFLPPRGRKLAADAEFAEIGSVVDWMQGRGGLSPLPEKQFKAFNRAIVDGDLYIKSTPAVALYDETATQTQILTLDDGSFAAADPCWEPA